jgi:hypothetical protein
VIFWPALTLAFFQGQLGELFRIVTAINDARVGEGGRFLACFGMDELHESLTFQRAFLIGDSYNSSLRVLAQRVFLP